MADDAGGDHDPGTTSHGDVAAIIRQARELGFKGTGGLCGEAAVAIDRVLFDGRGTLVGAFNAAFLDHDRFIGHVCVRMDGVYWDSDGRPKDADDVEAWGMLDIQDSERAGEARGCGFAWDDETAGNVDFVEFDHGDEVLDIFGRENLDGMVAVLERAVAMVRGTAPDADGEPDAGHGMGMR